MILANHVHRRPIHKFRRACFHPIGRQKDPFSGHKLKKHAVSSSQGGLFILFACVVGFFLCAPLPSFASGIAGNTEIKTNLAVSGNKFASATSFLFDLSKAVTLHDKSRFGTNILFWVDTKSDWNKWRLSETLSDLGVAVLRFPGGEAADNYDWFRGEVERDDHWPREATTSAEKLDRIDFKTFLLKAKEIGVEDVYFVVNLEGAFFQPGEFEDNVRKYAKSAALWVKAIHDSDLSVKYWEIGNESYLHSTIPLTAKEYAFALQVFSTEMKSQDPDIQIGAVGPWSLDGSNGTAFADRLHPRILNEYRLGLVNGNAPCKKKGKKRCAQRLNGELSYQSLPWWPQIVALAPDAFDFIVLHRYGIDTSRKVGEGRSIIGEISRLKRFLVTVKGQAVPIAMTEWNVPGNSNPKFDEGDHAIEVAAQLLGYYRAGVQDALYWPFRLKGKRYRLVDSRSSKRYAAFDALKLLAVHSKAQRSLLPASVLPAGVEVFGSTKQNGQELVLSGINNSKHTYTMVIAGLPLVTEGLSITQMTSLRHSLKRQDVRFSPGEVKDPIKIALPPKSMLSLRFH